MGFVLLAAILIGSAIINDEKLWRKNLANVLKQDSLRVERMQRGFQQFSGSLLRGSRDHDGPNALDLEKPCSTRSVGGFFQPIATYSS